jgi:hypothetical protein
VNGHRSRAGLGALKWSPLVAERARHHSEAMAARDVGFGHARFEARAGSIAQELRVARVAENIFRSSPRDADLAEIALERWRDSPVHLENMEGAFTITGVGAARDDDGEVFLTQIFVALRPQPGQAGSSAAPGGTLLEAFEGLALGAFGPVLVALRAVDGDAVFARLGPAVAVRRALAAQRQQQHDPRR